MITLYDPDWDEPFNSLLTELFSTHRVLHKELEMGLANRDDGFQICRFCN